MWPLQQEPLLGFNRYLEGIVQAPRIANVLVNASLVNDCIHTCLLSSQPPLEVVPDCNARPIKRPLHPGTKSSQIAGNTA